MIKMGEMGLNGMGMSEDYGGTGPIPLMTPSIIGEELSRKSAAVSMGWGAHNGLCMKVIDTNGTHEQKMKFIPDLISGKKVGALSMTEPGSGSGKNKL